MSNLNEIMLAKGYVPARAVAEKMGVHISGVYRLINEEKLEEVRVGTRRFVLIKSLIDYVGPEAAQLLGMTPPKKAAGSK